MTYQDAREMTDTSSSMSDDSPLRSPGRFLVWIYGHARRVLVFVIGMTVLLVGIAMIVLPGPAFVVIPLGLAILATEFVWARRWLRYAKRKFESIAAQANLMPKDVGEPSRKDQTST